MCFELYTFIHREWNSPSKRIGISFTFRDRCRHLHNWSSKKPSSNGIYRARWNSSDQDLRTQGAGRDGSIRRRMRSGIVRLQMLYLLLNVWCFIVLFKALKTSKGAKRPVYVSVGHRISLETAIWVVMQCVVKYRIPEPTRQADIRSREEIRKLDTNKSSVIQGNK